VRARLAGGVIRDAAGNLYGTTGYGGAFGYGIVYKISPTGTETILYTFTGGTDGAWPFGGLFWMPREICRAGLTATELHLAAAVESSIRSGPHGPRKCSTPSLVTPTVALLRTA
jgi:uncharacterized repeat protein (TIGR03803 family)